MNFSQEICLVEQGEVILGGAACLSKQGTRYSPNSIRNLNFNCMREHIDIFAHEAPYKSHHH